MGTEKLDVQLTTLGDHGDKLDALLEAAKQGFYRVEGEKSAYRKALEKVQDLGAHIDKDLEEGKFSEFGEHAMPIAALVKKWILRAGGVLDNLSLASDAARIRAQGQIDGLAAAVGLTQREYDRMFGRKQEQDALISSGLDIDSVQRERALSPAEDIRRRKEEAREEKAAEASPGTADNGASNDSSKVKKKVSSPKKRLGRRGKNT